MQPALRTPDLDVRVIAAVQVVARRDRPQGAVVELQRGRRRVLNVDRLAADVGGESGNALDARSGEVYGQVEPVNSQPDEMSAATSLLLRKPRLLVTGPGEPRLIRHEVHFQAVQLSNFSRRNDASRGDRFRVQPIGESEHQITMLPIGFLNERPKIFRANARRLLGKHVAARIQSGVDHRRSQLRLHRDEGQFRFLFRKHLAMSPLNPREFRAEHSLRVSVPATVRVNKNDRRARVRRRQRAEIRTDVSPVAVSQQRDLDGIRHGSFLSGVEIVNSSIRKA